MSILQEGGRRVLWGWLGLVVGIGMIPFASARHPPTRQPYYSIGEYERLVTNRSSKDLSALVTPLLEQKNIVALSWRAADGTETTIWPEQSRNAKMKATPAVILNVVGLVLTTRQPGVVVNLVHEWQGAQYPVSVRWSVEDVVHVSIGDVFSDVPSGEWTVESVSTRWGVELQARGEERWGPRELYLIDVAFSALTAEEKACIADVPFVLTDKNAQGIRSVGAYGYSPTHPPRIELYTTGFSAVQTSFHGTVDAPRPYASYTILHEIGHAIIDTQNRRAWAKFTELRREYQVHFDRIREQGAQARDSVAELQSTEQRLTRLGWSTSMENAFFTTRRALTPMEQEWATRMGPRWRLTDYSDTSDREGFAEMFGLLRANPELMRELMPDVVDWFYEKNHIRCDP